MATNYWEDEDEDDDTTPESQMDGSDLLKKLRKAKRSDEKRIKELTDQLDGFNKMQREAAVKSVLESKGVNPKAARLILNELTDVTTESVTNWLEDNGDLFGLQKQEAVDPGQVLDRAALRQQDIVTQGAITPDRAADTLSRINNATSAQDIIAMIHSGEF